MLNENLSVDEAGMIDQNLPLLTKVASLVQMLKVGGSSAFVEKFLWQFVWTTGSIDVEVVWSYDQNLICYDRFP